MGFNKWYENKLRKMKCYDIGLIKLSAVVFGLLIAKLYAPVLDMEWHWYAAIFVLAALVPLYHAFKK